MYACVAQQTCRHEIPGLIVRDANVFKIFRAREGKNLHEDLPEYMCEVVLGSGQGEDATLEHCGLDQDGLLSTIF